MTERGGGVPDLVEVTVPEAPIQEKPPDAVACHGQGNENARWSRRLTGHRSQQRPTKDDERDAEVDHQSRHVDQRRDKRRGGAGGIEAEPPEQERQHRAGE